MAKLKVLGEKPPAVPDKRLQELRDYIFRINDELEYLLTHLDEDNLSEVLVRRLRGYEESIEHIEQSIPNAYNGDLEMDSTASPGSSGAWARGDHVHPSDTSKANETELAYVETGSTASRSYAKGAFFCLEGQTCRAKTEISSGDTFTLNTNYEIPDGGGLNAIQNTPITTTELATFTGTTGTLITLNANASTFDLISIQVFDSDGTTCSANVLMPRPLLAGIVVKAYGSSSSQWGSFELSSNNYQARFNRTSANTSKVVAYGINIRR